MLEELRAARAHGVPLSVFRTWHPRDRSAALALQEYEAGLCGGCGLPSRETTNPKNRGRYRHKVHRCYACTAIEKGAEGHREAPQPGALRWAVSLLGRKN